MQISPDGASISMVAIEVVKKEIRKVQKRLRSTSIIGEDEEITGIVEEVVLGNTL